MLASVSVDVLLANTGQLADAALTSPLVAGTCLLLALAVATRELEAPAFLGVGRDSRPARRAGKRQIRRYVLAIRNPSWVARRKRRKKKDEPRFVCEVELRTTPHSRRVLRTRLDCARRLYNAVLAELLWRLDRARASAEWHAARELPAGRRRSAAFRRVRERFGLTEAEVYRHPSLARASWLRGHLDSDTAQNAARDAWRAVARHLFPDKRGRRGGRPRPRRLGELRSVEGKRAKRCVRLVREGSEGPRVCWSTAHHELSLPLATDPDDPYHAHALASEVRYVRIVRREIRGRERYFCQLVCAGEPVGKVEPGGARVGLDIGPSSVAVIAEGGEAKLHTLASGLDRRQRARRRNQRRADRQRRASNPDCYDARGRAIRGRRPTRRSKRQRRTERTLAELDRRQAAQRRNLHGRLANEIVAEGATVHAEKLSYRAFQRAFGRSVAHRAPGLLIAELARKAKRAGGALVEVPTPTTYLSQRCLCGARERKPLSERWHRCECEHLAGQRVQRDLFSAFLALYCDKEGNFDQAAAIAAWERWGANCLPRPPSQRAAHRGAPTPKRVRAARPESGRTRGDAAHEGRKAAGRAASPRRSQGRNPPASAVGNS